MNLIEVRDKLNELITEGKGHYQFIDDTEGLHYISHFEEGVISSSLNIWGTEREEFISIEDIKIYSEREDDLINVNEILDNKVHDAIRIF